MGLDREGGGGGGGRTVGCMVSEFYRIESGLGHHNSNSGLLKFIVS